MVMHGGFYCDLCQFALTHLPSPFDLSVHYTLVCRPPNVIKEPVTRNTPARGLSAGQLTCICDIHTFAIHSAENTMDMDKLEFLYIQCILSQRQKDDLTDSHMSFYELTSGSSNALR